MTREPGARIGPFEVQGELGRGATGLVLAAVDPSTGREVALKVLRVEEPRARERLAREGQAGCGVFRMEPTPPRGGPARGSTRRAR